MTQPARESDPPTMTIGEVLAHLRVEFTGLTVSKIRYLESEGLVSPTRRPSGYRRYSWDDVARLREVLTVQRDEFLPLKVIKERLAEPATDRKAPVSRPRQGEGARYSRTELIARSGLPEGWLRELESLGLVGAEPDSHDLGVATLVAELSRYGIEPRHLRGHRQAADRDLALIGQITAPLRHRSDVEADAVAAELAELSLRLHSALVTKGLSGDAARP